MRHDKSREDFILGQGFTHCHCGLNPVDHVLWGAIGGFAADNVRRPI